MRKVRPLALLGLGVILSGCLGGSGSLRPLYDDENVVFDPLLVGEWQEAGASQAELWTFAKGENKAYTVTRKWKGETGKPESVACEAHLVSLGMYTFLDTYPTPTEADKQVIEKYDYAGLHRQWLVRREKDTLRAATLSEDWLDEQVLEGEIRPRVAVLEQNVSMLIDPTRDLQRFFLHAAADPDAFKDFVVLRRVGKEKSATSKR
jgi:hypothetical protein